MADLYGNISQQSQNRQLGERFTVCLTFTNKSGPPASLLYVSATFDCWDSAVPPNHIVNAFPIVLTQTYSNGGVQLRYKMSTMPGGNITAAGTYRYLFSVVTSDGEIQTFEQVSIVNSNP